MHEIAPKIRLALRWLAMGAAGLAVAGALFASAFSLLVEDRALRDGLTRNLSAWSGGPVSIRGPIRLASFASFSIEANSVSWTATPRLFPIGRIEAKSLTAHLKVASLLRGRIEFKTVVVESPRLIFNRRPASSEPPLFGLETAAGAVAFADLSRFNKLELSHCSVFTSTGERRPYSRLGVERVRVERASMTAAWPLATEADASVLTLSMNGQGFEAFFRGTLSHAAQTALGKFRLKVAAENPASERIIASIAPWEQAHGLSLAGELAWLGGRASLDRATIVFGDRTATGSLAFAMRRGGPLLEGTLAYDTLEWARTGQEAAPDGAELIKPLRALIRDRAGPRRGPDLDMRISAEHFRAGQYEAGPLALALTSRPGRFSVDVAELSLFGGKITGRLDYDPLRPAVLALNANGTRLDSRPLTEAWPFSVSGPVSVRMALAIPFQDEPLASDTRAATGNFTIQFPSGGTLDGDLSKRLSDALAHGDVSWGLGSRSFAFATAAIDGAAAPGGITLKINGESTDGRIGGSLRIAQPGNEVSGTLWLNPEGETGEPSTVLPGQPPASDNIVLSGPVAALNFSRSGKPSLSN